MGLLNTTVYSFEDVTGALAHPDLGAYTFDGKGVGEISIEMTDDMTAFDKAADGTIMVSKLKGEPGRINITVQQTSLIHKWLLAAYQLLKVEDASAWANMNIAIRCIVDGSSHVATGVAFMKVPNKSYQAQGQRVTWTLFASDIQNLPI